MKDGLPQGSRDGQDAVPGRDTFARWVREVLENLHDRPFLATHPLANWFGRGPQPLESSALRRQLLEAIEQLKPMGKVDLYDARWRRYRHLLLRYVEGQSLEQIARILDVSVRQASRDHQQAITSLVTLLRGRCSVPQESQGILSGDIKASSGPTEELAAEVAKVAASERGISTLHETLAGVLKTVSTLMTQRGVTLEVLVPDTLPPVAIGPTLLRQVLLNLLIYATEIVPDSNLTLAGADTASGVIIRLLPDRRRTPGTMLCRPASVEAQRLIETVQQILDARGGAVEVNLDASADTLLRVVLPPIPLQTLLIVDDNPDLVALFRRYLRGLPFRLIQATSAKGATRMARELRPDLIILDVLIPSHDGWEILLQLRNAAETADTPIVICSVLPEKALAVSLGVSGFLSKPVTRQALVELLESLRLGQAAHRGHS